MRGGYKAYRREVVRSFAEPQNVTILSGCTGAGKTRLLRALKARGRQVLDLEGLSFHKGSAFGGYEQPETLTTEMFHNLIHQEWAQLDRGRPVWIEDEGRTMGRLLIPDEIWQQMRAAPVVFLDIAQEHRVRLLVEEYANHDTKLLRDSVDRIKKRLGGLTHKRCIEALDASRPDLVAKHCLDYYDKAYRHSLEKRQPDPYWELSLPGIDTESNTEALLEFMAGTLQTDSRSVTLKP